MITISIILILAIALHLLLKSAKRQADKIDSQVKEIFKKQKQNGKI